MGACETTPATREHPPGKAKPATFRTTTPAQGGLFLAPHDRPPLAGIKLVRPRPRLPARRCGRSSLTPARATAQSGSDKESRNSSPTPTRRSATGSPGQFSTAP